MPVVFTIVYMRPVAVLPCNPATATRAPFIYCSGKNFILHFIFPVKKYQHKLLLFSFQAIHSREITEKNRKHQFKLEQQKNELQEQVHMHVLEQFSLYLPILITYLVFY